ncbi:MAG TPA: class I SAM-dependent rRNA methyltransferase [Spirochaetia bacterium]|nr:class I SAM-dependent rRNA methyltransferase [Spirochaetia bacterium]
MADVVLRPGKEKLLVSHHPWGFSGAIASVGGSVEPGDIVRVVSAGGSFIAYALFNPKSKTALRLIEWDESRRIDDSWWYDKLQQAIAGRASFFSPGRTAGVRLVHGEADGLPGLVCDLYGDVAVLQITSYGIEKRKSLIVKELIRAVAESRITLSGVYERSESDVRSLEGMDATSGVLWGRKPEDPIELTEHGVTLLCSITAGQKGGMYFDQRENRRSVARYSVGRRILDAFCYTGGFSAHALKSGAAHTTLIDASEPALDLAVATMRRNGFAESSWTVDSGDIFRKLREYRRDNRFFDLVILDPPKLASTRAAVEGALRGYKDLNLSAMAILARNGHLATFSCSGRVSREQFRTAVTWAARDAGREVQILETFSQAADHPVRLSFPESEYLKGYLLRMVS